MASDGCQFTSHRLEGRTDGDTALYRLDGMAVGGEYTSLVVDGMGARWRCAGGGTDDDPMSDTKTICIKRMDLSDMPTRYTSNWRLDSGRKDN